MELFNEMTLLICSYFLFAFTDFVGDANTRFLAGWAFIGIVAINILVNWMALLYKVASAIRQAVRGFLHKRRVAQYLQSKAQKLMDTQAALNTVTVETVQGGDDALPKRKKKKLNK
jgi:hypothetical protein